MAFAITAHPTPLLLSCLSSPHSPTHHPHHAPPCAPLHPPSQRHPPSPPPSPNPTPHPLHPPQQVLEGDLDESPVQGGLGRGGGGGGREMGGGACVRARLACARTADVGGIHTLHGGAPRAAACKPMPTQAPPTLPINPGHTPTNLPSRPHQISRPPDPPPDPYTTPTLPCP